MHHHNEPLICRPAADAFIEQENHVPAVEERRKFFDAQFTSIDVDRDGKLTREEVEAYVIVNFNEFDLNRDGKISKTEILVAMQPRRGPAQAQPAARPESINGPESINCWGAP